MLLTDPDEEPLVRLKASGKRSSNAGAGTDSDPALVEGRRIAYSRELFRFFSSFAASKMRLAPYLNFPCPDMSRHVLNELACEVALNPTDHIVIP